MLNDKIEKKHIKLYKRIENKKNRN
jgi:hypothetical protein